MTRTIQKCPSPNFNERNPAVPLQYVVLHYTGMETAEEWINAVCDPETELSAHYLIEENGAITQFVDENKRAWHAGESFWRGITDLNSASIGVELANPGHQNGYRPFPPEQISALKKLLRAIMSRHKMDATAALLAHSDIAPTRKQDPGELFPWRELAEAGFGFWPEPQAEDYAPFAEGDAADLLRTIGYDCPGGDFFASEARAALLAFQRRYRPENLTGTPDAETTARLRALKALQATAAARPAG